LTSGAHREGDLLVYIDPQTQQPVAYQWGGLLSPGILEVRNDWRGRGIGIGIGKSMVEHCLAVAAQAGDDLLWIQCTPSSSIPFWQHMGFTILRGHVSHEQENHAYRVLSRVHGPQEGDATAQVSIEWFPECRKWDKATAPAVAQVLKGVWLDNELALAQRASFFRRLVDGDVVVRVVVDGQEWYFDKAKYESALALGVEDCRNGFRVDTLYRPSRLLVK
jgi:hypothetical protein